MVFPSAQQPRDTYHLWRVFDYLTDHGPVTAVAIPSNWRESVVSIYSNMLGFTYIQIWIFIVAAIIRYHKPKAKPGAAQPSASNIQHHNPEAKPEVVEPVTTIIQHDNPEDKLPAVQRVAFHEQERFWVFYSWTINQCASDNGRAKFKNFRAWIKDHLRPFKSSYATWLTALGFVWFSKMGIAPALIWALVVGEGAPANGDALFFPQLGNYSYANWAQEQTNIFKPSVLRALTIAQIGTPKAVDRVQLNETNIGQGPDGEPILQFDYAYNISGLDFGMQHFGDLSYMLRGSCYTEYGWLQPGINDSYSLWNHQNITQNVTLSDQQRAIPRAFFVNGASVTNFKVINNTYAAYVSTSGKSSITSGTDPWYFTKSFFDPQTNSTSYSVENNRPVLSCWETNFWTWKGQEIGDSSQFGYNVPGFPLIHRDILYYLLYYPPISFTATYLDTINLAASEQDVESSFDAGAGSIYKDLNRLLVTSFVWNSNILFDLTLNNQSNTYGILNYILTSQNATDAAEFVVYTSNVAALAFIFVIIVPIVMIFMIIATYKMGDGLDDDYQPKE